MQTTEMDVYSKVIQVLVELQTKFLKNTEILEQQSIKMGSLQYKIDILLVTGKINCPVEVKTPKVSPEKGIQQLVTYMSALSASHGILTTYIDWYLIKIEKDHSFSVIDVINYRNFWRADNITKISSFIKAEPKSIPEGKISKEGLIEVFKSDEQFEKEKSKVEFRYVPAIVTTEKEPSVTPSYGKLNVKISTKWGGIKVEDPKCVKPSCRKFFGIFKKRLIPIPNYPSGLECEKCGTKYYLMDPRPGRQGLGINDREDVEIPWKVKN